MAMRFTLEYWVENSWYIGRLKEVPGVFSQGESLEELEKNIRDAYRMMADEEPTAHPDARTKELEIEA